MTWSEFRIHVLQILKSGEGVHWELVAEGNTVLVIGGRGEFGSPSSDGAHRGGAYHCGAVGTVRPLMRPHTGAWTDATMAGIVRVSWQKEKNFMSCSTNYCCPITPACPVLWVPYFLIIKARATISFSKILTGPLLDVRRPSRWELT